MTHKNSWTTEEDIAFENIYGKISCEEICKRNLLPGRTQSALHNRANRLGLKNGNRKVLYSFNEKFWDVPNPINSYWSGELSADGCLQNNCRSIFVLSLQISINDLGHLKKFKNDIEYTGPITFDSRQSNLNPLKQLNMCKVSLSRARVLVDVLRDTWGIIPRKTHHLAPPKLNSNILKLCFCRGFIDGDGTITADYTRNSPIIRFTSSALKILIWFKELFDNLFPASLIGHNGHEPTIKKYKNCYYYSVSGGRCLKIVDIMSRLPTPVLDRKWNNPRFLAIMDRYKQKYPNVWAIRLPIEDEIDTFLSTYKSPSSQPGIPETQQIPQINI
jgi:hypothetical protein